MDPIIISASIIILLLSVIIHEVMHGWVALKFGDHTAERAGRLTLNPLPHIDPIGTILLPGFFLFLNFLTPGASGFFLGWAKPVPVNPLNFSNIKRGELLVSLAGVGSNFALAAIAAIFYHLLGDLNPIIASICKFTVAINLSLGAFNLLPIPPLDGSKALIAVLPYTLAQEFEKYSNYGFFIILTLLYLGLIGPILNFIIIPLHILLQVPRF